MIPDTTNEMFHVAAQLVNQSSRNIFLTGKAGTGKTTFLKYIRDNCPKQMAVVAPTGVAAINAGGVTIHSFFQLPFSPFIPDAKGFSRAKDETLNSNSLVSRLRLNKEKIKVLQQLEILIIDEISMVRCDTMDAIDTVLRYARKRPHERFGGVQMLFIGDMFQLPPVIKDSEWKLLAEFYGSPYFFDSLAIRGEPPLYIEFNKVYRQSEERFINLLNQLRDNRLDEDGIKILEAHYHPGFRRSDRDGYIILTTHNGMARSINVEQLERINAVTFTYNAEIEDEFAEYSYPAEAILQLKLGAQVMFIKNDTERNKRYYNGKIGRVTKLAADSIVIQCEDIPDEIEVKKERWEHIRYSINKLTRQMDEEIIGSFTQYPLRLAWAITIHKSQGLTFEKAIIDAGEAFAPGQVYVALSRCRNLDGLVLKSKLKNNCLFTDQRIVRFSQGSCSPDLLQSELLTSTKDYREKLLLSAFDLHTAFSHCSDLRNYVTDHSSSFNGKTFSWLEELGEKIRKLKETASKFQNWLRAQFRLQEPPGGYVIVQERMVLARVHFIEELSVLIELISCSPAVTDSRLHAKEFNDSLKEIFGELSIKRYLLQGSVESFDVEAWHLRKKEFVLPHFTVNSYAASSQTVKTEMPHSGLHLQLRKLRDAICEKKDLPIYMVAGSQTMEELVHYLPQTLDELKMVSGFGEAKIKQYGQLFLDVIVVYCKENDLRSLISEKAVKKEKKETKTKKPRLDTKAETLRLFREGLSVYEIAGARKLASQTIEGHLSHYVSIGKIKIEEVVSSEKRLLIEPVLQETGKNTLTSLRHKLGNAVGFGEIRLMIAWKEYQDTLQNGD